MHNTFAFPSSSHHFHLAPLLIPVMVMLDVGCMTPPPLDHLHIPENQARPAITGKASSDSETRNVNNAVPRHDGDEEEMIQMG